MKIAYLIHYMKKNYDEITENLDTILEAGDDCYVIVNDDDLRDELMLAYGNEPSMHLVHKQEAALPGDLSLPRGMIISIADALEEEEENGFNYDAFINLTDGMIPITKKKDLEDYLNKYPEQDIYYVEKTSEEDPELMTRFEEYAFFTNSMDFQKSKIIQGMNKFTAGVIHNFKQKKLDDVLVLSYPWFVLRHESAVALAENLAYCSNNFKMCMYPEELAIATMLKKFSPARHHNENIWRVNEDGIYKFKEPIVNVSREVLNDKNAFFAAKIHSDENFDIYQDYFDIYE